jgi:hypothetical protein
MKYILFIIILSLFTSCNVKNEAPVQKNQKDLVVCASVMKQCPDGSSVGAQTIDNTCQWVCPTEPDDNDDNSEDDNDEVDDDNQGNIQCLADVKQCDDGNYVSRNVADECNFFACPIINSCSDDVFVCPDGVNTMPRLPENECEFQACPTPSTGDGCNTQLLECSHGRFAIRNHDNNCNFNKCPEEWEANPACPIEKMQCPNEDWVRRNPLNNCHYIECK